MSDFRLKRPSIISGLAVTLIGAVALYQAIGLNFGNWASVGAGALPTIVSVLIIGGGLAIISFGFLKNELPLSLPHGLVRASLGMFGAIIVFALTIKSLGMVPAVALCAFISSLAAVTVNWRHTFDLVLLLPLIA